MPKIPHLRAAAPALALALLLCGCSMDVESLLHPPRARGDREAVQSALETYIADSGSGGYTLDYPTQGSYTSAFILCDAAGQPVGDNGQAEIAAVFYSLASAPEEPRVNLLRKNGKEWVSVGDHPGFGPTVRQVEFADLDGDGTAELLAGFGTYNSREHRLGVFSVAGGLTLLSDDRFYSSMFAGALTAADRNSLMLLRIGTDGNVTATLEQINDGVLTTLDTVSLAQNIRQFGKMTFCRLTDTVSGLYVDGETADGTLVTELIYYDGTLHAPLSAGTTERPALFSSRDIDGDLEAEIPRCTLLPGYAAGGDTTAWLTVWRSWDISAGAWREKLTAILNTADGYRITVDPGDSVTTAYDPAARQLALSDGDGIALRLTVTVTKETERPAAVPDTFARLSLTAEGSDPLTVWYDPTRYDAEKLQYIIARL